ncbi:MAG: ABC transporter substrate-binding protein [Actinobacteria bacterium]|nr:ABC transporter substrate-binding protein [Actinomycetota bacterium]MBW3647875.1 ABC transporter substrate-binding protein [Actinomycetota bacterium]
MRARTALVTAVLSVLPLAACGGGSDEAGGVPTVNWYIGNEGWLDQVIEDCNAKANGAYQLVAESLPTNPDQQREQLVRRLAARDDSIDLIGMDVVWTSEFGQAGWVTPFEDGELKNVGSDDQVLQGPFDSAQYDGKQYGAPLNSNTRLLWYRKSVLGDRPVPATWDQLLDTADQLDTRIQQTGKRAESLMVFFNALVESAGTSIVEPDGEGGTEIALAEEETVKALSIMQRLAESSAAPVALSNSGEDDNRLAFQAADSGSAFMINWPYVYPSVLEADPELAKDYGWAPYPRVDPSRPAAAPLGGYNLGIGAYTNNRAAALAAINCLTEPEQQRTIATVGGQPSVLRSLAEDPAIQEVLPFLPLMTEQLETAAPRPVTPSYNDLSLAVRQVLHPMRDIEPESSYEALRDLLVRALNSQAVL